MSNDSILYDIPWVVTTEGNKTPFEAITEAKELDSSVPGYLYGAQFRFLLTLVPGIELERRGGIRDLNEAVRASFDKLEPWAHLFDKDNPFLQIPEQLITNKDYLKPDNSKSPIKISPSQPSDKQRDFWAWEDSLDRALPLPEAVQLLVAAYLYVPRANTWFDDRRPNNGSSALRYVGGDDPAVEIIAEGKNLWTTLRMNTPKNWIEEGAVPHWADREGRTLKDEVPTKLWRFTWTTNVFYCYWNEDKTLLEGVGCGGAPEVWVHKQFFTEKDKGFAKSLHDLRSTEDPLYFYREAKNGDKKLLYLNVSNEVYLSVAHWHADKIASLLKQKWNSMVQPARNVSNIIFIENKTEGSSTSFTIRHSKVVIGYKEAFLPEEEEKEEILSQIFERVLNVYFALSRLFNEGSVMDHIKQRKADVQNEYWNELKPYIDSLWGGSSSTEDALRESKNAAVRAFERVSPIRDTSHLKQHFEAINRLGRIK